MSRLREFMKWLLAASFTASGINHFLNTPFYASIVPPYLPWHVALVYVSGIAEIGLAAMLVIPRLERLAAWGMICLIVAVTPANIQMAVHPELYPGFNEQLLLARVPLQLVILAWAFWFTRPAARGASKPGPA
jgi:uncharacterized membrane protein